MIEEVLIPPGIDANDNSSLPIEVFPQEAQTFINNCQVYLGHNREFVAGSMLATISAAIGRSYVIRINPSWVETVVLWICLIGRPGSGKTPAIKITLDPIYKRDAEQFKRYKLEKEKYNEWLSLSKDEKEAGTKRQPPVFKKSICSDITMEGLTCLLENNPRGITQEVDEYAGLVANFNRYNSGSDLEKYLSLWSGGKLIVDRTTKDPIYLTNAFLSIIGGTQPGVIEPLFKNRIDNGFADRTLFVWPERLPAKKLYTSEVDPEINRSYNDAIIKLLDEKMKVLDEEQIPNELSFTLEAEKRFAKFYDELQKRIEKEPDERTQSLMSKLDIHCARLSLILQLMRYASREAGKEYIDLESLNGAILLTTYFERQAIRIREHLFERSPVEKLDQTKQKFYDNLPEEFTTKEAVEIGRKCNYSERFVKKFLNDSSLFNKIRHGKYGRLY